MIRKIIPWIVFAIFGYFLVGNNFSAKLGMIDDHEIALFLGSDGQVTAREFIPTILSTEVGKWGSYLRYRPSYYTLRVLETALWRDNATLWYVSRYVILVIAMWLGWRVLGHYFPEIVSYVFIFYLMTIPFWTDLLTRLGPSEIYGLVAIPLFIYGTIHTKWWMIVLGYVVAVGAKENFLILFPIVLLYGGYRAYTKVISRKEIFALLTMITYTLFIVGAIQTATAKSGADIYGATISYSDRLAKLYSYKRYIVESRHLQLALAIFIAGSVKLVIDMYKKGALSLRKNVVGNHLVVATLVGIAILSQYVFYDSNIPSNIRYDYPVMLLFPILQMVAVSLLIKLLPKKMLGIKCSVVIYFVLLLGMVTLIYRRGYGDIQVKAQQSALGSQRFENQLKLIQETAQLHPESTLVFVSDRYFSFEPIISVGRFLRARKINNTLVLAYTKESGITDTLGQDLESRFVSSMEGTVATDDSFVEFSPASATSKSCYSITYGTALSHPTCPEIAKF